MVATLILSLVANVIWENFITIEWAAVLQRASFNFAATIVLALFYNFIRKKQKQFGSLGTGVWTVDIFSFIAALSFVGIYIIQNKCYNTPLLIMANATLELSQIMISVIPVAVIFPIFQKKYGFYKGISYVILLSILLFNLFPFYKIFIESSTYEMAEEFLAQAENLTYNIYSTLVVITLLFLFRGKLFLVALVNSSTTMLLQYLFIGIIWEVIKPEFGIWPRPQRWFALNTVYFLISCACIAYLAIIHRKRRYSGFLPDKECSEEKDTNAIKI